MFCNNCGKEVIGNSMFCPNCGTAINQSSNQDTIIVGQNDSVNIPKEIRGWNWGGFLLSWIWGIGNNVWIALLALIPYVGIVMAIILGIKGNEWAWQKKKWDSIETFKKTQRTWANWGAGVFFGLILLGFLMAALIPNLLA